MLAAARLQRWIEEGPALFALEALGAKPTDQQIEASLALAQRRRVSIRSGHGTGKSAFMAWSVLWGLHCFPQIKVPVTAPTSHQLSDVLWAELATWHRRLPPELQSEFEWTSERYVRKDRPAEAFAVARTSRREQPEALQGFHAPTLLFILDEASGIPDEVFQVAEGALSTDGAYVVMAANPTQMSGYFYDSHHKMRSSWAALHWNGEDSPLVSREFVRDMAAKWGEHSPIYRIRVRGEFAGNIDGVIPLHLIDAAIARNIVQSGAERWGLDVARFGDDRTALVKRKGNHIREPAKFWHGLDTQQVAGVIKLEYDEARSKPEAICVDVIGIGAGVVDRLKEMGLPVIGVNVAESPSSATKYAKLRDELWFTAREWFEQRSVSIVKDDELIAELTLPIYTFERASGKLRVEPKDEMKKRLGASPDLADAFCLTFAHGVSGNRKWKPINYSNRGIV